jgi:hypothetical protein
MTCSSLTPIYIWDVCDNFPAGLETLLSLLLVGRDSRGFLCLSTRPQQQAWTYL